MGLTCSGKGTAFEEGGIASPVEQVFDLAEVTGFGYGWRSGEGDSFGHTSGVHARSYLSNLLLRHVEEVGSLLWVLPQHSVDATQQTNRVQVVGLAHEFASPDFEFHVALFEEQVSQFEIGFEHASIGNCLLYGVTAKEAETATSALSTFPCSFALLAIGFEFGVHGIEGCYGGNGFFRCGSLGGKRVKKLFRHKFLRRAIGGGLCCCRCNHSFFGTLRFELRKSSVCFRV